eukprot:scaffold4850_cov213-Pinguiococcus_pyrenoidosus.AAC.19
MPLQEFVVLAAVRSVHLQVLHVMRCHLLTFARMTKRICRTYQIVRAHEGGDTSFHRGDEGPVVGLLSQWGTAHQHRGAKETEASFCSAICTHLEEAPLITVCIYGVSIGFLIVQYEMLCHRQEAVVLYGSDVRPSHLRPENLHARLSCQSPGSPSMTASSFGAHRVFATDVFSIAPSFRHAVEIETWSENHVRSWANDTALVVQDNVAAAAAPAADGRRQQQQQQTATFASELLSKSRAPLVHKIHIEGGPHCKKTGPAGDLAA